MGPKDRLLVTTITMCLWSAGHLFTVLVAYFVRSRVWLEVIFTSLLLPCVSFYWYVYSLRWRHNGHDSVSNHQPRECLLNSLIRCRSSKKTSKLRVTGLCVGNSPKTGEFPAQRASNVENVSIWWRHHVLLNGVTWAQWRLKSPT